MCRRDVRSKRTRWRFAYFAEVVNAAGRTFRKFSCAVELDVRREVGREVDWCTVGQMLIQGELICSTSYFSKVVNASIGWACAARSHKMRNTEPGKQSNSKNYTSKNNDPSDAPR